MAERRLVFVMGVQRSGTNALFKSLERGAKHAFNEADDSPLFTGFYLRDDAVVCRVLDGLSGVVLAKPISETKRRSVNDVFAAYANYDLSVIWIYRDPVNCYASHIERWTGFRDRPEAFATAWSQRNQSVLDALGSHGDRITLVRYEDLTRSPAMVVSLGASVGLRIRSKFRRDHRRGRRELSREVVSVIEEGTQGVLQALDHACEL